MRRVHGQDQICSSKHLQIHLSCAMGPQIQSMLCGDLDRQLIRPMPDQRANACRFDHNVAPPARLKPGLCHRATANVPRANHENVFHHLVPHRFTASPALLKFVPARRARLQSPEHNRDCRQRSRIAAGWCPGRLVLVGATDVLGAARSVGTGQQERAILQANCPLAPHVHWHVRFRHILVIIGSRQRRFHENFPVLACTLQSMVG